MTGNQYQLLHSRLALGVSAPQRALVASAASPGDIDIQAAAVSTPTSIKPANVGLWDLGAWLGGLAGLIESMNACQSAIRFFQVSSTLPAGIVSSRQGMLPWIERKTGKNPSKAIRAQIQENVIAEDFYSRAEVVRRDLQLDYLVGITDRMVAGADEEEVYWNHFSTFRKRLVLASCADLRVFAKDEGVSFESLLGSIIVAQVLVAMRHPKLGYHEDRGCLFDYNGSRITLPATVKKLRIEEPCLESIGPKLRDAALALAECVKAYKNSQVLQGDVHG